MLRLISGFLSVHQQSEKYPYGIPPFKRRNRSGVAKSEIEKADELNGQFTDASTKTEHSQVPLLDRSVPFIEQIVFTKEGVTNLLKCLNTSKVLGPNELHPRYLKELAKELGLVFAHFSSSQLIQVISLINGPFRKFAPCSRRATSVLPAVIVRFP